MFIREVKKNGNYFNASGILPKPRPNIFIVSVSGRFLSRLGPDHRFAVPDFSDMAKDPNPGIQRIAIIALYRIGEIPEDLAPMLMDNLSKNQYLWAQDALIKLGPKAKAAVPRLIKMMDDKRPWAKAAAANVLAAIGLPDAKTAIPAIERHKKRRPFPEPISA